MSEAVIRAEGLGKKYLIGHQASSKESYSALRDVIGGSFKSLARNAAGIIRGRQLISGDFVEEFWALKDVSFEINRGDVVGIIGRNGAGKSTLLKILSRITEPSEGRVEIKGRIASLLEVGTGFHPELTGRENIYLNGAILGMSRAEIRKKFEEIVDFAGVEKFLDTPVKRYSSGMYVRLAFGVAAHLEPEIMVVDEVLAVGDAEFQKKCLGKMQEVAGDGRTVLFVSHNLSAVEKLCDRAFVLDKGIMVQPPTDTSRAVARYLSSTSQGAAGSTWSNAQREFNHPTIQLHYLAVLDANGKPLQGPVRNDEQMQVVIRVRIHEVDPAINLGIVLFTAEGQLLLWSAITDADEADWPKLDQGDIELRCKLPGRLLNEGSYRIELFANLRYREWIAQPGHNSPSITFDISGGLSDSPYWHSARTGILAPVWLWHRTS